MKTKLFLVKRKSPNPNFCYTTIPSKFSLSVLYKKPLLNDQILYFLKHRVWKACFTVHKPMFDRWATPWPCCAWQIQWWTKMFDCLAQALARRSLTKPRQVMNSSILLCVVYYVRNGRRLSMVICGKNWLRRHVYFCVC